MIVAALLPLIADIAPRHKMRRDLHNIASCRWHSESRESSPGSRIIFSFYIKDLIQELQSLGPNCRGHLLMLFGAEKEGEL